MNNINMQPLIGDLVARHGSIQAAAREAGVHPNVLYTARKHQMRIDTFVKLSLAAGEEPSAMLRRLLDGHE